jgi:hypothetical protein
VESVYISCAASEYVARGIEGEAGQVHEVVNNHVLAVILHAGDLVMLQTSALRWTEMGAHEFLQDKAPR